mmetsp:Transcript_22649/g.38324  ORF Transcript_22649/g.38324 Transcript_22649/m.38324 type:complete len:166 (+) Transcript_22649:168-665(+)
MNIRPKESGEKRTVAEWVELVVAPAGYEQPKELVYALGASTMMSSNEFKHGCSDMYSSLKHSSEYVPLPLESIKYTCDACGNACISMCICGAPYCSRDCLGTDWAHHRSTCVIIYDNSLGGLTLVLSDCEMRDRLSESQYLDAWGGATTNPDKSLQKPGASTCAH